MNLHIKIRPAADRDLDDHFFHIARNSVEAASRLLEAAQATIRCLAESPELGVVYPVEHQKLSGLRVWQVQSFRNYLIFYLPIDRGIEVVRVLHGARDIPAVLGESI